MADVGQEKAQEDSRRRPQLRIVLVGTTHPGNIGGAARAMKAMGLSDLALVAPKAGIFPSEEATARAVSAADVLESASVHDALVDAVADCNLVVGTTARARTIGPEVVTPREFCGRARPGDRIALVFGRERTGLENDEVAQCHFLVRIPTGEAFASLNLAAAVQIMTYEWILLDPPQLEPEPDNPRERPATAAELDGFFDHTARLVDRIGFFSKKNPALLMRRLRRLYQRAGLDITEINILRGILSQTEYMLDHKDER